MLTLKAWARMFFLLLLITSAALVNAQNTCQKPQVFYVNGVWNFDGYAATGTATALNEALVAGGAPGNLFIRTIWSPGDSVADDVLEVLVARYWDMPGSGFVDTILGELFPRFVSELVLAAERYRDQIEKIKKQVLAEITGTKTPVVVIAHSQGNIMANQAITELQKENADTTGIQSIGILGIANADKRSSVGNYYRYITSNQDKIIKLVPFTAPVNFDETSLSGFAHKMDYYLAPNAGKYGGEATLTDTRAQIQKLFLEVFNATQASWPCVELSSTPNPSNINQSTTLAVTVKARPFDRRIPDGLVRVREGEQDVCTLVLDGEGKGTCPTSFSVTGSHSLKARYLFSPSGIFRPADSEVYVHSVVNTAIPLPPPVSGLIVVTPDLSFSFQDHFDVVSRGCSGPMSYFDNESRTDKTWSYCIEAVAPTVSASCSGAGCTKWNEQGGFNVTTIASICKVTVDGFTSEAGSGQFYSQSLNGTQHIQILVANIKTSSLSGDPPAGVAEQVRKQNYSYNCPYDVYFSDRSNSTNSRIIDHRVASGGY